MGKGAGKALGGLISGAAGGGGGSSGGLSQQEQAMLAYQAHSEAMKETAAYTDYGIPYSSGLAHDLGSIGFQTAAEAGQIQQSQYGAQQAQQTQQANALGQLGTALGSQSASTGNPDTSNLTSGGSLGG